MQNILKITSRIIIVGMFLSQFIQAGVLHAFDLVNKSKCEHKLIPDKKKSSNIMSSVCDIKGNQIDLLYSKQKRRIWLKSNRLKQKEYTVLRLEKGADPELIGADKDIAILFGKTIELNDREFLVLTIAERTNRGGFGGQCGSGEEVYLKIYELKNKDVTLRKTLLVYSCIKCIDLDTGDGSEKSQDNSITLEDGVIKIKWLSYLHCEGSVIGSFDILENRLRIEPREQTKEQGAQRDTDEQ